VVIISGAPGVKEREKNPLLHHKVKEFDTQLKVFKQLTVATTVLNDAEIAFQEIDRVIHAALRYKRPVYIELPRDMVDVPGRAHHRPQDIHEASDPHTLAAALAEATDMIHQARKPVIIADVEVHRFGLQDELLKLAQKTNIPVAATILGKSVIAESHPTYLGVYEGAMGREPVRRYVESSDCVILLGAFMTDINLGIFTARLDPGRSIYATSEKLSIRYHNYEDVRFKDFMRGLLRARLKRRVLPRIPHPKPAAVFRPRPGMARVTVERLFQRLDSFLGRNMAVIADVGDALFGAADLHIRQRTEFLSPAYYTSMGFAIPASVGAQLANPRLRPLVLVGDGAFQMTGLELATVARYGLNPIVIVLNNSGYGTERQMQDGPYNESLADPLPSHAGTTRRRSRLPHLHRTGARQSFGAPPPGTPTVFVSSKFGWTNRTVRRRSRGWRGGWRGVFNPLRNRSVRARRPDRRRTIRGRRIESRAATTR